MWSCKTWVCTNLLVESMRNTSTKEGESPVDENRHRNARDLRVACVGNRA